MGSSQSKSNAPPPPPPPPAFSGSGGRFFTVSDPPPNAPVSSEARKGWQMYDYIIVGGGSAGCVLASRLSENPTMAVLLIEAGKASERNDPTSIPFGFPNLLGTDKDWNWATTPQKGLNGRTARWHGGKVLGGTSATNGLIYQRCPPQDFDEWVSLGAEGWSYPDLQKYFLKAETYHPSSRHPYINPTDHGRDGPLQTGFPSESAPVADYMVNACRALGLQYINDINAGRGSLGVTHSLGSVDADGRRSSTATAYLSKDVLQRPNLTVALGMMAQKVIFSDNRSSGEEPRAVGVQISSGYNTQQYTVSASREVLLCAGTVGTPQILMLSGIGPSDDLQKFNIPVVRDMPAVGRNLIDHISTGPLPFRVKSGLTYDSLNSPLSGALAMLKWRISGAGPLSSLGYPSTAFVRSTDDSLPYYPPGERPAPVNDRTSDPSVPDLQLVWFPLTVTDASYQKSTAGSNVVSLAAICLKPESRGRISLRSSSVWDPPLIDPNYLSTESDVNVLVRGVRLLLRIARTEPMASKITFQSPLWASNVDPDKITDGEIRGVIRNMAFPGWNPVGSARIGRSFEDSVVDPELRVHGIAGLRIVDASVFPTSLSGQTCAVVVAMAEKASDMIKQSV